jgi:hypothetical protein
MVYSKPEVRLVANALSVIQAHQKGKPPNADTGSDPRMTNSAYEADE